MIEGKKLIFWLSVLVYLAALPFVFLLDDAMLVRIVILVVFTGSYAYGVKVGLLIILISVPLHGLLFACHFNDWQTFLWTFHPLSRAMQLFVAFTMGWFKVVHEKLEATEVDLRERTHELERALAQVRELKGIIRICATCKDICDENGHWISLENYITERSRALFSHGMCPVCYEKEMADLRKADHKLSAELTRIEPVRS